jgi:Family of unknown function (DUF5678)
LKWLTNESSPYAGEWVALDGPRLVAHGEKLANVRAAAKTAGVSEPFFARVPWHKDTPFGGWLGMYQLEFARVYYYSGEDESVEIPVVLRSGANQVPIAASLDTGASFCIFGTEIAKPLGLKLSTGIRKRFRTANSGFEAYGHLVELHAFGVATDSLIYFFADPMIDKNVLGRTGWLDRVRLGLIHHDNMIYFSP